VDPSLFRARQFTNQISSRPPFAGLPSMVAHNSPIGVFRFSSLCSTWTILNQEARVSSCYVSRPHYSVLVNDTKNHIYRIDCPTYLIYTQHTVVIPTILRWYTSSTSGDHQQGNHFPCRSSCGGHFQTNVIVRRRWLLSLSMLQAPLLSDTPASMMSPLRRHRRLS
jgi:hypothetical protein